MTWKKSKQTEQDKMAIAKAFQDAVVETLKIKTLRALEATGSQSLVVAGGVGANRALREGLTKALAEKGIGVYFPRLEYCTDNGAMVAYAGCLHLMQGSRDKSHAIEVFARLPL